MKKSLAFMLLIIMLMPIASFASDYSEMTVTELKAEMDKILLELSKKSINTDKQLCDSDGFKVYISGDIQFDSNMLYDKKFLVIPITAINESNQALQIRIEKISFNGWEVDLDYCVFSLDANKKIKDKIEVTSFLDKTDIVSTFQIQEIEAYYRIMDSDFNTISDNCRTALIISK